ncbi:hypothetical protein EDF59_12071 [Novosphingobium sp. ST904]|nr:hypothetical protein EDF59_12071 [Novosphingobium sp. ST904]
MALRHTLHRLESEVAYLTDLIEAAPAIVADEKNPRPRQEKALRTVRAGKKQR